MSSANVLGQEYLIELKKYSEEKAFSANSIDGYHDGYQKKIVICDMHTYPGWENEEEETIMECQKQIIRHEITHAFLHESGLCDSSTKFSGAWARNEEMIDWIALQGLKIYQAWKEAGAI